MLNTLVYFSNVILLFEVSKNTASKNPNVARKKSRRIRLLSKCAVSDGKKSKTMRQQEAGGLSSIFGIKTF